MVINVLVAECEPQGSKNSVNEKNSGFITRQDGRKALIALRLKSGLSPHSSRTVHEK